ncbi:MAG: hypothetical protein KatS3mg001_070 [Candidatus Pacearchaeota archaeon]|nr:MAG: hypothetical protein KatS3mg001_070 [Candidatus Pacearchaeota archaeon]
MILLINICKEPLHALEFVKPIEDILKKENVKFLTKHYKEIDDIINKNPLKVEKIIICGTSLSDNEFLNNLKKFDFLLKFKKPVLGICGGAHIIGLLLGCKLKKQKKPSIGFKKITIKKEFLGVKGEINAYHLNQFRALPETFQKENFYATLFHPEVRNKEIIVNFVRLNIGPAAN